MIRIRTANTGPHTAASFEISGIGGDLIRQSDPRWVWAI